MRGSTRSLAPRRAFPDHPPYGGQFADTIPHLIIGDVGAEGRADTVRRDVGPQLPIAAAGRAVWLMTEQPGGRWQHAATFPLGSG